MLYGKLNEEYTLLYQFLHNLKLVFEIFEMPPWSRPCSEVRHPIYRASWNGGTMTSSFWYHVTEVIVEFYLGKIEKSDFWILIKEQFDLYVFCFLFLKPFHTTIKWAWKKYKYLFWNLYCLEYSKLYTIHVIVPVSPISLVSGRLEM